MRRPTKAHLGRSGLNQLFVLLDDVGGVGFDGESVEPAGMGLARLAEAEYECGSRESRQERGFDCALEVERVVIAAAAHTADGGEEFAPHGRAEGTFAPGSGIDQVKLVEQGAAGDARASQCGSGGAQQLAPALFHNPANVCLRQGGAQHGHGGQGVHDISHGAEAHDEHAGRHEGYFPILPSRSVVEWSLGSPTISTRPP